MGITRRAFVRNAGGVALFNLLPRRLIAGSGMLPPSETVRVASIGAAGRPCSDIDGTAEAGARIVGLCDVDTRRTGEMVKKYPQAKFFKDWREMLDRLDKEIDAVIVGTPDHWHAIQAIECLKRGKHVQCEKPLAQSYHEVDDMIAAAKESKLVNMAMNQGHAYDSIRDFREWIEAGLIGNVTEAHIWCPAVYSFMDDLEEMKKTWEIPAELDWERWQGPVPHRAYFPKYLPGVWRFWTMYGTTTLGDWSCHLMDPLFWTFGLGAPIAVKATPYGTWDPAVHGATFPKGARTVMDFKKADGSPFRIVWYDGIASNDVPVPPGYGEDLSKYPPKNSKAARDVRDGMTNGAFVYGSEGVIEYGHHGANYLRILGPRGEELKAGNGYPAKKYPRVAGGNPYAEFLGAIRGGPAVGSDFAYAGNITKAALLSVAALFEPNRRLEWDDAADRFKEGAGANRMLRQPRVKA